MPKDVKNYRKTLGGEGGYATYKPEWGEDPRHLEFIGISNSSQAVQKALAHYVPK